MNGRVVSTLIDADWWLSNAAAPTWAHVGGAVWATLVSWCGRLGKRPLIRCVLLCALPIAFAWVVLALAISGVWSGDADGYSLVLGVLAAGPISTVLTWIPIAYLVWLTAKAAQGRMAT